MRFTRIICYQADNAVKVEFYPLMLKSRLPGFSHRVIISHDNKTIAKDWLATGHTTTAKSAEYYYDKHKQKIEEHLA